MALLWSILRVVWWPPWLSDNECLTSTCIINRCRTEPHRLQHHHHHRHHHHHSRHIIDQALGSVWDNKIDCNVNLLFSGFHIEETHFTWLGFLLPLLRLSASSTAFPAYTPLLCCYPSIWTQITFFRHWQTLKLVGRRSLQKCTVTFGAICKVARHWITPQTSTSTLRSQKLLWFLLKLASVCLRNCFLVSIGNHVKKSKAVS